MGSSNPAALAIDGGSVMDVEKSDNIATSEIIIKSASGPSNTCAGSYEFNSDWLA